MKLAIFDIDGTLTETNEVDDVCFVEAFADVYHINDLETDWTKYKHVTDSGILLEVFEEKLERRPKSRDIAGFKKCFVGKLKGFAENKANLFAEIPGANAMLEKLKLETDWAIALATGCFYDSAEIKIKMAKMNIETFPCSTAEDAISREEILRIAIKKSLDYYGQNAFEKVVSIGDGVWDLRTAKNLKIDFIGVGNKKNADKLRREGAEFIVEDFRDYKIFFEYLNK